MTDLVITRFCDAPFGTFGRMIIAGQWLWTVERPWLGNQPFVSCIPDGEYECRPRRFNRGEYDAIEISNVPSRSYILFHKANLPQQLGGCIAPASTLGCQNEEWAGLGSGAAFELLMAEYGDREFILRIERQRIQTGSGGRI